MKNEFLRKRPSAHKRKVIFDLCTCFFPFLTLLLGLFFATQQFASSMNYDSSVVGQPILLIKNNRIYNPLLYLLSYVKYAFQKEYAPYLNDALKPLLMCVFLAFVFLLIFALLRTYANKNEKLYGTARWGTEKDLKNFGLIQENGVTLGQIQKAKIKAKVNKKKRNLVLSHKKGAKFICHSGENNTLGIAPTRAGKGVSWVIPTLLRYFGSIICFDPKAENYHFTAKFRSLFSHVIKFAPLTTDTIRFNPVAEIRDGINAYRDANTIADTIFAPPSVKGEQNSTEDFFNNNAKDLFTTVLLHVRFSDFYDKSIAGVLKLLSQTANTAAVQFSDSKERDYTQEIFEQIRNTNHSDPVIHEKIIDGAGRIIQMNSKVRSDVMSTLYSKIQLFEDPLLAYATSGSDFQLSDFVESEKPISLYLIVPFSDVDRIAPVFRLLITFVLRKFSDGETGHGSIKLKNHLLFMLDEFPILGCFPFLVKTMGVLAGYGITFFIICQGINQLIDLYGVNHPFFDHCKTVALFAPGKYEDAKMFCDSMGKKSVVRENISTSGNRFQISLNNINLSDQEVASDLINPDELLKLPPNEVLILNHGMSPYIGKKIIYYGDPRFIKYANLDGSMTPPNKRKDLLKEVAGLPSNMKYRKIIKTEEKIISNQSEREEKNITSLLQTEMFEEEIPAFIKMKGNKNDYTAF